MMFFETPTYGGFCVAVWPNVCIQKDEREDVEAFLREATECSGIRVVGCVETIPDGSGTTQRDVLLTIPHPQVQEFSFKRHYLGEASPVWLHRHPRMYQEDVESFVRVYR